MDLLAVYYHQMAAIPFFRWGLDQNRDSFRKLILLSDARWEEGEEVRLRELLEGIPTIFIDTERPDNPRWHGVGKLYNLGIQECTEDFAFFTSVGQILAEDCLSIAEDDAAQNLMVLGMVHTIAVDTRADELAAPRVIKKDCYLEKFETCWANPDKMVEYMIWRNGHTLVHVPTYRELGGFDENYCALGYGMEDYDLGIRWLTKFGRRSIVAGNSYSWALEKSSPKRLPSQELLDYFNPKLRRFRHAFGLKDMYLTAIESSQ